MVERGEKVGYSKNFFMRIHYEDMWSPYEKCQEIVRGEWGEQCKWEGADAIEILKNVAKRSMAELVMWNSKEFGGREKKAK